MHKVEHDSETPAQGQQVITAVAFIYADFDGITKVFTPKRADTKKFLPGKHELPGGHIDYGENVEAGLAREIQEEFSMKIRVGSLFGAFDYVNDVKGSHSVELMYFAEFADPLDQITVHPEDHSGYEWASENEIAALYGDPDDVELHQVLRGFKILSGEEKLQ